MTREHQGTVSLAPPRTHLPQGCIRRQSYSPPPNSPLLRVQVTAAHSDGEETWGTVWWTVAVQETPYIEAKVHSAGQIVRVCIHTPDNLFSTEPLVSVGPWAWGSWKPGKNALRTLQIGMASD